MQLIDNGKTAYTEGVPERTARWIPSRYKGYLMCSACENCHIDDGWRVNGKWRYCPECGAKMVDGDEVSKRC